MTQEGGISWTVWAIRFVGSPKTFSTAEVGEVLGRFPGVLEANVYGAQVPNHEGRAGCAAIFIAPEERNKFDWHGLFKHARQKLPRYASASLHTSCRSASWHS
ncbi:hypothetical protein MRB53_040794 [Persea americana]|nr:hypothetical protein MRB53_040794 [Persea americana]